MAERMFESRQLGIGQLGLASWVSSQKWPVGSQDLKMLKLTCFEARFGTKNR
jgi:hypothetical protein